MTLPGPILDDRSYDQLRTELLRRLPVYAPEWTNHNESDPGIALLELFAYLGESVLYRFNQIPDATKVAFLNLLGARPRPAQVATVLLAAATERPDGVQVLARTEARAGAVSFETMDEVYVWPMQALSVGKVPAGGPAPDGSVAGLREKRRRQDAVNRLRRAQASAAAAGASQAAGGSAATSDPPSELFYEVRKVPTEPTGEPLDVSQTVDQSLWVALLAERDVGLPTLQGRTLFLGVAFDETIPAP
ncbi:hypothetical protein PU560_12485, partial [Georgenia sp. 10Sc9-8]|nr:hypothetical protein [Georgenia halotolerans]